MHPVLIAILVLALIYVLVNAKRSRADGNLVRGLHPYRRMMFFIMPTRTESLVYFDSEVRAGKLLDYLKKARESFDADVSHMLVAAVAIGLLENPKMNRFVVGKRLYQRHLRSVTFSMKRKALDREAKLATVRTDMVDGESFKALVERINSSITVERSGQRTYADKEYDLFNLLPRPLLARAARFLAWLDSCNLLPASFIATDALYTSCFIANLGSLGMGPAYHHLFEWGNCPLFLMAGRIEDRPVARDGELAVEPVLPLRWTYDERIDDGLTARHGMDAVVRVLEDPERWLGGLGGEELPLGQ